MYLFLFTDLYFKHLQIDLITACKYKIQITDRIMLNK
jgi:hypothetical protein